MKFRFGGRKVVLIGMLMILFSSCTKLSKIRVYHSDSQIDQEVLSFEGQYELQPGDILHIYFQDVDPEMYSYLIPEVSPQTNVSTYASEYLKGVIINDKGFLSLPYLDSIDVKGWSIDMLTDTLNNRYSKFSGSPNVHVRLLNFYVNVIGDVSRPGIYKAVNGEKYTLQEALSQAGGMRISGDRTEVVLIRNNGGENQRFEIDLTSRNAILPHHVYLKKGDIIYVQETRRSYLRQDLQFLTIAVNTITSLLTILVLINRL